MFSLIAGPVMAESPDGVSRGVQSDAIAIIPDYDRLDPALAQTSRSALIPQCPASGLVAFSVTGISHISQGNATLLGYQSTLTNAGGGWTPGGSTFITPCSGLYVFTASFVRAYSTSAGSTWDDVYVHIFLNGASMGYAWAGQADISRSTGTYTVSLLLQQGDYIQTFVTSQSGYKRYLNKYDLTGYLVRPF
ncbi:C1q-like domain-containing protein [Archangium lansingense]|uniref:C1q-like domain-containing protein n=1 Tax=Archangium lansingense TaxID=2995310 RepID=UPI003B80ECA4